MAKIQTYSFIIDLTDTRNKYLFESLQETGKEVFAYAAGGWLREASDKKVFLFAPTTIIDDEIFATIPSYSIVFCTSASSDLKLKFKQKRVELHFYFDDEELAVSNAYLTAEGALAEIIRVMSRILPDLRVAVLGFGRVGRAMSRILLRNGSEVCIVSREQSERVAASNFYRCVFDFESFKPHLAEFDVIVNTVPSVVLGVDELQRVKKDCFILDLASKPYGVDFEAVKDLDVNAVLLSGIPGKTAPQTAADLIKTSVFKTLNIKETKVVQKSKN